MRGMQGAPSLLASAVAGGGRFIQERGKGGTALLAL